MTKAKAAPAAIFQYTAGEEIANSIIHGLGTLGAITGLVLLAVKTAALFNESAGRRIDITAAVLFTATMIGMFLISTLYHAIRHEAAKRILQTLDHSMIYLFIAGSYIPFCLSVLKGGWGWTIFAIECSMAAIGITLCFLQNKALKKFEVAVYIVMGWVIAAGFIPLARALPRPSLILLFSGGAAYTLGTLWYRKKNIRGTHIVWHSFVLLGAVCHWLSVWFLY